jgi:penicillin-binding protein 2
MKNPNGIGGREGGIGRRGFMLLGIQMLLATTLGYRMRQLQVEQSEQFRLLAEENRVNMRLLPPARGLIFDRKGVPIAENRQNYRVNIVREQTDDPEESLNRLAKLVHLDRSQIEDALADMKQRSAFVPVTVAEHLTWEEYSLVSINMPALPGIITDVGLSRFYPQGENFAHIVGYVGPVSEKDLAEVRDPDPVLQIPKFQIGKNGIERIPCAGKRALVASRSMPLAVSCANLIAKKERRARICSCRWTMHCRNTLCNGWQAKVRRP